MKSVLISCAISLSVICVSSSPKELVKEDRHLPSSSCSKLQYEIQKAILTNEWGLQNLKFQQRLKRHPKYIVTIQHIRSTHDPLIELRCPGNELSNNLEIYFHESRFSAESVRLFDINSIFPIHSGSLSVKIKLEPLVIILDKGSDLGLGIAQLFWKPFDQTAHHGEISNKEHREEEETLFDLEKEIETVFIRRIQPDVQKQIRNIVSQTARDFFSNNLVRF